MIRTVTATRYVTPLREGGSLPAIVEADDDGLYVIKFRGAGQGVKALIAELITGEIGRSLGLLIPELVLIELDPVLGRSEPDPEIQALIKASAGLNLAMDYLPGSLGYDPLIVQPEPELASSIVWFDAYTTNVDRTPRNTNMLIWHRRLWLIDHGASLFFHHNWPGYLERARSLFPQIKDHVLLPYASELREADARLSEILTSKVIRDVVQVVPDSWLDGEPNFASVNEHRDAYARYLVERLGAPRRFVEEALDARLQLV